MALIQCPECHREVSDQADACPHCGYPLRQRGIRSEAEVDDQVLQKLVGGNKIAAIKLYRDLRPETSLFDAKDYVERLAASRPPPAGSLQDSIINRGKPGGCLGVLMLILLSFVCWAIESRWPF